MPVASLPIPSPYPIYQLEQAMRQHPSRSPLRSDVGAFEYTSRSDDGDGPHMPQLQTLPSNAMLPEVQYSIRYAVRLYGEMVLGLGPVGDIDDGGGASVADGLSGTLGSEALGSHHPLSARSSFDATMRGIRRSITGEDVRVSDDRHWQDDAARHVFATMVAHANNGAGWLGSNSKLTRIKFSGGLSSVLGIRMQWQQFGTLTNGARVRGGEGGTVYVCIDGEQRGQVMRGPACSYRDVSVVSA